MNRLAELDLELQMMKYERNLKRTATPDTKKFPMVIWAEKEQFSLAA